ncbi:MAG: complex I subunit 5 family protein [Pseudohaliea sp.]
MSGTLLLSAVLAPLLLAACWAGTRPRALACRLAPFAPLPALMLALAGADGQLDLPWLLLGVRWGLDSTGRFFLGLSAGLWFAAGIYGQGYLSRTPHRCTFQLAWLLTMAGNLGLTLALDMLSFLLFFTLMSIAAYPLIIHDRKPASLRAGRVYLVLVIIGELLLFWAAAIAASSTGELAIHAVSAALSDAPHGGLVTTMVLLGFGIKVGIMPLHSWLPLAHPAAPTPASAVLSGAMIKAGLLGWLRFLPAGSAPLVPWGEGLLVLGLGSTFLAALLGLTQHNPKTVLAYSSVSQMGLASMLVGAALLAPTLRGELTAVLLVFVLHHGVAKAALFLGTGFSAAPLAAPWQRRAVIAGLLLPAASLAGLPLTLGYVAKKALVDGAGQFADARGPLPEWLLMLSAFATTLLLCRFLVLAWPGTGEHTGATPGLAMVCGWLPLLAVIAALAWLPGFLTGAEPGWYRYTPGSLWAASWPALCAIVVALITLRRPACHAVPPVPAGDLVVPVERLITTLKRSFSR